MTPSASPSLTQRIHSVYAELPAGERKAADLVLDMPGELAIWTASELAGSAGVSGATISRFVRRLGYASFEEARKEARAMRAVGSPLYLAERATGEACVPSLAEMLAAETSLLNASFEAVNPSHLDELAGRLAAAQRIRIAGFRNSYVAAEYGRATLAQFRPDVEMLNAPGQTLAEGIAGIGKGDVALIIGLRRRPAGFSRFVNAVAATGADVALLADPSIRAAPAAARWNLVCVVETPQILDSYTGVVPLLRILALATMRHLGSSARRHLEHIETIHETLAELD